MSLTTIPKYENILLEIPPNVSGVAVIKLNRPKVLNALSTQLMNELVACLNFLDEQAEIGCAVLTGNDKAFAAGADIAEMSQATPIVQIKENRFRAWRQIGQFSKPLIAAVSGFALGGGLELAMSCDFIVAADNASFGQPETNIGTMPGAGGTQRLTRALGKSKAMYHILTGESISAEAALNYGLVAKIVPARALMGEVLEIAQKISAKAPIAIRLAKQAINKSQELSLTDGLDFERNNFFLTFASHDQKEGMAAFLEKRRPNYTGA